jgi:hypothetical protein
MSILALEVTSLAIEWTILSLEGTNFGLKRPLLYFELEIVMLSIQYISYI